MKEHTDTTEPPVASAEKMHLHPVTLAFRGTESHLEKPFLDDYFTGSLFIVRFALLAGLLFYSLFGILDACLIPEKKALFWLFRYGVFFPLSLAIFFLTFLPLFKKIMQPLLALWGFAAGGGIITMTLLAPPPVSFSYYAGLILIFMMAYTVVKLRFLWACCTCWCLVFFYEYAALFIAETPILILLNNSFFFIGTNLIGMISCYAIEHHARRDFYMKSLLHEQREQVSSAKDQLEKMAQLRTLQLIEANTRINREMKGRTLAKEEHRVTQAQLLQYQEMELEAL